MRSASFGWLCFSKSVQVRPCNGSIGAEVDVFDALGIGGEVVVGIVTETRMFVLLVAAIQSGHHPFRSEFKAA